MNHNRHFVAIVAGDNAEEIMLRYDAATKVAPYVVFEFAKAEQYKKDYIESLKNIILNKSNQMSEEQLEYLKEELQEIQGESATDYFLDLTDGMDIDPETGDAMTTENPNEMFTNHSVGGRFALPFILKGVEGQAAEVYSAKKGDIDWSKIHLANQHPYEVAWDTTHGLAEPQDDDERNIYEHMKNMTQYFLNFESREHYIASSTAFWGFAFADESGWYELEPNMKQFDWVINFYDRFIKPLPDDTLLTIYECVRPEKI